MGGLTDEEAEETLDELGFEPPDEKKTIELKHRCSDCGYDLFRILEEMSGGRTFMVCDECGARHATE